MEAGKRDITMIFNRSRKLEIPFFQRAYVWGKEAWTRFADDLVTAPERASGYFLGSIILKQKATGTDSAVGDVRTVVDGQQRLTTLVLFFRVLCDEREEQALFNAVFRGFSDELILQHNHNDIEVFEALAGEGSITAELAARFPESRVLGAFKYFKSRRSEIARLDPRMLLSKLYFVGIDLGADEDEQQIFDTINSLGVDLTSAELLKNHLFGRQDHELFTRTWKATFEATDALRHYWERPVTSGREKRQNVDLFLQAYLLSQDSSADDVRVGELFHSYRKYLRRDGVDRQQFIEDLTLSAQRYRDRISPALLDRAVDGDDAHERLNVVIFGLQTTTILPLYLRILRSVEDPGEQSRMVRLVESYVMRRLICGETTKHYNRFFASLARSGVGTASELEERLLRSDDPSTVFPTDERVREGFRTTNLTNRQARVVLYLLEAAIRDSARHSTALAGFNHYTLEHVMPKKWRNHWGSLPEDLARARDGAVRKLGNLTLLSSKLNNSVRDADWARKKSGSDRRAGLERYAVGTEIFDEDLRRDTWDERAIGERAERLAAHSVGPRAWPMPA